MSVDLLKNEAALRLDQAVEYLGELNAGIEISIDPNVLKMSRYARNLKPPTDKKAVYWVDRQRCTSDNVFVDDNNEFIVDIRGDVRAAERLLSQITFTLTALPEGFQVPGLPESLREHERRDFRTALRAIVTTAKDGLLGQSVSLAFCTGGLEVLPAMREYLRRVSLLVSEYQEFVPDTLPLNERYVEKSTITCEVDGVLMATRYATALFFARDFMPPPVEYFKGWEDCNQKKRLQLLYEYRHPLTVGILRDQQIEPPYFFEDLAPFAQQFNGEGVKLKTVEAYLQRAEKEMADRKKPVTVIGFNETETAVEKGRARRSQWEQDKETVVKYYSDGWDNGVDVFLDIDPAIESIFKRYGFEYPTDRETLERTLTDFQNLN